VPNQTFTVELFANTAADPSDFGEGQTFLGAVTVVIRPNCHGSFTVTLPIGVGGNKVLTATATDAEGNTSEFSRAIEVVGIASVGGMMSGLRSGSATCRNLTTGQTVSMGLLGATSWNCEAAGLVVNPGDTIRQAVQGTAD
jgi:hypothetical protein